MKYTFTLAFILVFAVIGCKKKATVNRCYVCNRYELIYSPIYVQYNKPRTLVAVDTVCNMNDQTIQLYMNTHMPLDTVYKGDTPLPNLVILNQHSSICSTQ